MRIARPLPQETTLLYSPIALRLLDEFSGTSPLGRVQLRLQRQDADTIAWTDTNIVPLASADGIHSYPGLGRASDANQPPRRFRVLIEADFYRPYYRRRLDGLEFDVHPFNDSHPLHLDNGDPRNDQYARGPRLDEEFKQLLPNTRYPFPIEVAVVRGDVVSDEPNSIPLEDVFVTFAMQSMTLTDERGNFALPVRWLPENTRTTSDSAIGAQVIVVDNTRGLANGFVQILGDQYKVTDANSDTKQLTIDPVARQAIPMSTSVTIASFGVTLSLKNGPPTIVQVSMDQGFSEAQRFKFKRTP